MAHLVKRAALLGVLVLSLGACTTSTTEPRPRGRRVAATAATGATGSAFANLEPCPLDAAWRCRTVTVPLDRAEPEGETLEIAFYGLPNSAPPRRPRSPFRHRRRDRVDLLDTLDLGDAACAGPQPVLDR